MVVPQIVYDYLFEGWIPLHTPLHAGEIVILRVIREDDVKCNMSGREIH